jgi:endo-1,4-beta-xylanase
VEFSVFASVRRSRSRHRPLRAAVVLLTGLAVALSAAPASGGQDTKTAEPAEPLQQLPSSFQWSSTGPLISPQPGAGENIVSVKDPSVVQDADGTWHVFMTTADTSGDWSLAHTSFSDWSQAGSAEQTALETASGIGTGYRAAPQAFYFAPRDEWYLVYQTGLPSYSTTTNPGDPASWSAPQNFQDTPSGGTLDYWVICDDAMCYLFSSNDDGRLYRAETTIGEFPGGFGEAQVVMEDSQNALFEGEAVYRVGDTGTYLLIMEAIGSDGRRWYRSFTAEGLTGEWQPLADTEDNPFARSNNVTFDDGNAWTQDISHGELIREGNDQTMTIDPCSLQLLYQGLDPAATGEYPQLPWRLALASITTDGC